MCSEGVLPRDTNTIEIMALAYLVWHEDSLRIPGEVARESAMMSPAIPI
jgi:hypothetical protein